MISESVKMAVVVVVALAILAVIIMATLQVSKATGGLKDVIDVCGGKAVESSLPKGLNCIPPVLRLLSPGFLFAGK